MNCLDILIFIASKVLSTFFVFKGGTVSSFSFEVEVEEGDKEDFKDDIVVRKFGWTCDNL